MRHTAHLSLITLGLSLVATAAYAACEVEYKAKRDKPLVLYYDVATINAPCASAEAALRAQLEKKGQTLLKVMSKKEK